MNYADVLEEGGEGILDCFAGVFFTAVGVEEFELVTGLAFDHCEPVFEKFEDSV